MGADILIVDDEADIRRLVQGILEDEGYTTRLSANSTEAFKEVQKKQPDLIILDIWLQDSEYDGLEVLKKLKAEHPFIPFVMISGHGTIETAVSAIKDGAYDFIEKPFKSDRLLMLMHRALETASLRRENAALKKRTPIETPKLDGVSDALQQVRQIIDRAAPTNSRILITGEAGTGKDIAARMIHENSTRKDNSFLSLNCATLRPERFEIELFGAEAHGQESAYIGILEQAHGGTLLLDEVADMPLQTQGKIARALQEQRFHKIGGQDAIQSDVRVLATTNKNLVDAIKSGEFREDLYYRLNVVQIVLPPLRKRREDIPLIIESILNDACRQFGLDNKNCAKETLNILQTAQWAGNVRQLKNMIEWMCIMHGDAVKSEFMPEHLPPEFGQLQVQKGLEASGDSIFASLTALPLRDAREVFEREYLEQQIVRFEGNISKTAEFIGMERSALHRKLKSLNITHDKNSDAPAIEHIQKKSVYQ